MKYLFSILLFSILIPVSFSQEKRGTIFVEKKGLVSKIIYDNVNYRLIGIDQYGNVLDSAIHSFEMKTTIKGIAYSEKAAGPTLSYEMQKIISRCDGRCKLFFDDIMIKDNQGGYIKMKPFTYTFGETYESNN